MSKTKLSDDQRDTVIDLARDRRGNIHCAGCNRVVRAGGFELDHIVPEIESTPEMRSDIANFQVLCAPKGAERRNGCHAKKTAAEAKARAKAARTPRQRRKGLLPGILGLELLAYAVVTVLYGPDAGQRVVVCTIWGIAALILLALTVSVYIHFRTGAPLEPKRSEPKPVSEPSQASALDSKRIASAFREAKPGKDGTVTVDVVSQDEFVIHYPGTSFDDGKDGEGRAKLIDRINSKLHDRWQAGWFTEDDYVRFTRRPALPEKVPHPGLPKNRKWHEIPIGDGVGFDLMKTSHVLIIGVPNAGKTSLIRAVIVAVADSAAREDGTELILADPKMIELLGFEGTPGVRRIVTEDLDLWDMAIDLEAEMRERYRLLKEKRIPLSKHRRLIVVVDEYEQYFKRMRRLWQNGDPNFQGRPQDDPYKKKTGQTVPPPIDAMQSVLSMARRAGIHIIIGTQSPDATWFGGSGSRENLQGRAAVGPIDRIRALMAFDDSSVGRDLPPGIKGRTTIQMLDGVAEEVQTYWVPDPFDSDGDNTDEDWAILARLGFSKEE